MQPTFLPWAGFFHLMAQADDFVFLDDVQLEKQSWQTRNRWLIAGRVHWLSVPVRHTHLAQTLAETEVLDNGWRDKLARGFEQHYGRHPHAGDAREIVQALLQLQPQPPDTALRLAGMNEALTRWIAERLGLAPRLHRASTLGIGGQRSQRLAALCRHFGAAEYLSPVGSAEYLAEDRFEAQSPAALRLQDYQPQPYPQRGAAEFVARLSILDVVAQLGWRRARTYVEQGVA